MRHLSLVVIIACSGLLTAVPAPRDKPTTIIGSWDLTWGTGLQQSTFRPDGTCDSPQFGTGTWYAGEDGAIWFTERGGNARYVMVIDWKTMIGQGAWVSVDGEAWSWVEVSLKRRVA